MNQAIKIIDEMIDTLDIIYADSSEDWEIRRIYNAMKWILWEAKTRISSLPSDTQWIDVNSLKKQFEQAKEDYEVANAECTNSYWTGKAFWEKCLLERILESTHTKETLEDIIEDIGKWMCHLDLLYPNAWYWTLQSWDQFDYKWEDLKKAFNAFRWFLKAQKLI